MDMDKTIIIRVNLRLKFFGRSNIRILTTDSTDKTDKENKMSVQSVRSVVNYRRCNGK
ncbi:hypothetical protein FACS1894102_7160 [Spirochaetia bacterium]|nr:hypothetical protein FACS1894102_7160 [Spirochaetia bacterium]